MDAQTGDCAMDGKGGYGKNKFEIGGRSGGPGDHTTRGWTQEPNVSPVTLLGNWIRYPNEMSRQEREGYGTL